MSKRNDRVSKPQTALNRCMMLEARNSELETALAALWALWNDKHKCAAKADYMKGHLSYGNMLTTLEAPIRAVLRPDDSGKF